LRLLRHQLKETQRALFKETHTPLMPRPGNGPHFPATLLPAHHPSLHPLLGRAHPLHLTLFVAVSYCVTVVGRTARRGRTRADATRRLLQHFIHSLRVQVLPLPALHGPAFFAPPPAHTPSRGVRHPSFKFYDRLHHRSPLRFKRWRELCRAPASPPSFDQRTTRRLPRLWRFLFLVGFPCATPPRPRFFVA